jgi:hypothetical protein
MKTKITKELLKLVKCKSANILIAEVNTYYDDLFGDESVPFLDLFISNASGSLFDSELKKAIEHDEIGYVTDPFSFEDSEYVESEISLGTIYYSDWPENGDKSNKIVISILKEIVAENTASFSNAERFYFHRISEPKFTVIFEKTR